MRSLRYPRESQRRSPRSAARAYAVVQDELRNVKEGATVAERRKIRFSDYAV